MGVRLGSIKRDRLGAGALGLAHDRELRHSEARRWARKTIYSARRLVFSSSSRVSSRPQFLAAVPASETSGYLLKKTRPTDMGRGHDVLGLHARSKRTSGCGGPPRHSRACGRHARALLLGLTTEPKVRRLEGGVRRRLGLKTCPNTA